MKTTWQWALKLAAILASGAFSMTTLANGYRIPDQDAFATARGEAFAATADNPSAIYYNPAGIGQLEGNNLRVGLYGVYLDPTYSPAGRNHTFHSSDNLAAVPQFYYTYNPAGSPVTLGLGVYSPFGLSVNWPQNTGFRSIAVKGALSYITINPVIGLKLAPNFYIGGGVTVNRADVDLQQGLSPFPNNDLFRFKGDGWAVGYNLGALWQPHEKVSIGMTFRSSATVDLHGHTTTEMDSVQPTMSSPAQARFPFPLNAVCGISYRPTPDWNLEFDADYTDWSTVGTISIHQSSPSPILPLSTVPFVLNWQPSWLYEFGATRYLGNGWQVSAGYAYNENSVPNAHYTPYVADVDRHFFSLGTGFKGNRFNFDVAYQLGYGPSHRVSGSALSLAGQTADGTYSYLSHVLLLSVGMHF